MRVAVTSDAVSVPRPAASEMGLTSPRRHMSTRAITGNTTGAMAAKFTVAPAPPPMSDGSSTGPTGRAMWEGGRRRSPAPARTGPGRTGFLAASGLAP